MAHVQGPGGVGGYELHLHRCTGTGAAAAVSLLPGENLADHPGDGVFGQEEVDEARPGHLHPLYGRVRRKVGDDRFRDTARRALQDAGQGQRHR